MWGEGWRLSVVVTNTREALASGPVAEGQGAGRCAEQGAARIGSRRFSERVRVGACGGGGGGGWWMRCSPDGLQAPSPCLRGWRPPRSRVTQRHLESTLLVELGLPGCWSSGLQGHQRKRCPSRQAQHRSGLHLLIPSPLQRRGAHWAGWSSVALGPWDPEEKPVGPQSKILATVTRRRSSRYETAAENMQGHCGQVTS